MVIEDKIIIKGAREHNLKNIDVEIPRGKITVITGLSGSGKSTLAFDTLYAEGQRRYVESLSAYARQFLGIMNKPDVDSIEGLSPAISIDQKTTSRNPRSTVGTVTEIYDYLRLLYARVGQPHCPICKKLISKQGSQQIVENIFSVWTDQKVEIFAPIARGEKGTFEKELEKKKNAGFYSMYINGEKVDLSSSEIPKLNKNKKQNIITLIDGIMVKVENKDRINEAVETGLGEGNGTIVVKTENQEKFYSKKNACPEHGISLGEIQPRDFSFNSPFGACGECHGLGFKMEFEPDLIIPDKSASIINGAIRCYGKLMEGGWRLQQIREVAINKGIDIEAPIAKIPKEKIDILLYGAKDKMKFSFESKSGNSKYEYENTFEGIVPQLERLFHQTESESRKEEIAKFMLEKTCPKCKGKRLKEEMLCVLFGQKSIIDICDMPISEAKDYLSKGAGELSSNEQKIATPILKEIRSRLEFLENVGLNYLNLARESSTLSGGESQRIRLATQIGSNLTGIVYVLDEPSIGLHQRDNGKLINTLKRLRDLGNTLVVVEHDEETIINGANENNLKNITVAFPLGVFTCITGVSGSGKSSLVYETLYPVLSNRLNGSKLKEGKYGSIKGIEKVDKTITVDQSPIGRTPRSNPATYIGAFTPIREIFAKTEESKIRGYGPGRFSFNVAQGRCETCEGDGLIKIAMHFLADVYVPCETCKGKRYDSQTLEIIYKGKNISDVLDMSVEDALDFFKNIPTIRNKLETVKDVGLGYIKLGQPATTLSGGEAQRVKLANELSKRSTGKTIYLLDEPTTGLHFDDVKKLLEVLQRL
ncbi:ATP-binding cassette domain-containing protein, partial [Candidatus Micrarchaeota archaeon]|nr:ATP-binding cassette domain-containing protein [Candidatus Micrarchaeota archaeon]